MKSFRLLCFAALLTVALTVPALADGGITQAPGLASPGQTDTPPCAPGEMNSPPCLAGNQETPGIAATGAVDNPTLDARGIVDTRTFANLVFALRSWVF